MTEERQLNTAETTKKLDFSNFEGPKINTEWKPDDQDLIYTALNWLDGEGDADEDCGQQLVERLLSAWRSSLSLIDALDTQSSRTEAMRKALGEAARWLRNGDYDTRGGLSEMSRIAGVCETALGDVADYECENCIGMPEYGCYCQAHGAIAPGGPAFKALSNPNPGDADGWRAIETAPMDGTYILGYGPHKSRGYYLDAVHFYMDRWTIEWMEGYGAPTHWIPLPAPPASSNAA